MWSYRTLGPAIAYQNGLNGLTNSAKMANGVKIDVDSGGIYNEAIDVSDVQSSAARDAFIDFIWNKVQGER